MSCRKIRGQRGAALIVGMIMLVLITLMLIAALNLSTTNFRAVSNMQYRDEALAAANLAIEQVIGSKFTDAPKDEVIPVSTNGRVDSSGSPIYDYDVYIAKPTCVKATKAFSTDPSSLSLPASMSVSSTWNTVWELDASVYGRSTTVGSGKTVSGNVGGAAIRIKSGVRVLLSDSQKTAVCS